MRTIGRRELHHNLGKILDEIEETGEAVLVTSRGSGGVVIRPKSDEPRDPLEGRVIRRGKHRLRTKDLPTVPYDGDVDELIAWTKGDR